LANVYLGYDSHIVAANASPLQQSQKSQISRLFLFVEFLAKRDRVSLKNHNRVTIMPYNNHKNHKYRACFCLLNLWPSAIAYGAKADRDSLVKGSGSF